MSWFSYFVKKFKKQSKIARTKIKWIKLFKRPKYFWQYFTMKYNQVCRPENDNTNLNDVTSTLSMMIIHFNKIWPIEEKVISRLRHHINIFNQHFFLILLESPIFFLKVRCIALFLDSITFTLKHLREYFSRKVSRKFPMISSRILFSSKFWMVFFLFLKNI